MSNSDPLASRSGRHGEAGATLAELLVVMTIVSILAVVAVPVVQVEVQRQHETELRHTLRTVRLAIDRMHDDWRDGLFPEEADGVSDNGFPETLEVLISGIEDTEGTIRRYLRSLPVNVFARREPFEEQWLLLAYKDPPDTDEWSGTDIYDLRAHTSRSGLDGTDIATW